MQMPGRKYSSASSSYRYGFNGKENDKEVKGEGNQQDYGLRIYDPRLVRFLSEDPLTSKYPFYSPYHFAGNSPIKFIDLDGAEPYDPAKIPTGIGYITITSAPGVAQQTRSMWYGNYELRGIWGDNGSPYWIARYHYTEGKYAGMYNDEYVVGPDAVYSFLKDAKKWHNRAEWAAEFGTQKDFTLRNIFKNWVSTISNPVNWILGASIYAGSLGGPAYRATVGRSATTNYRGTFFAAHPELEGKVVVHHAVEQQILTRYPGRFTSSEINSLENLRGIPKSANADLHLSKIRKTWNEFYRAHPNATREKILEQATLIDNAYGTQFNPSISPDKIKIPIVPVNPQNTQGNQTSSSEKQN
jgi:RHS repeat-associated protein